ncbi:MAG: hypothetical protein N2C14_06720, partial [Planctomycetales bacterium]
MEKQTLIKLVSEERDRRMREVERLRNNVRVMTKQATGKDPFIVEPETGRLLNPKVRQVARLMADVTTARLNAARLAAEWEVVRQGEESPSLSRRVEGHPAVAAQYKHVADLNAQINDLKDQGQVSTNHPAYQRLAKQRGRQVEMLDHLRGRYRKILAGEIKDRLDQAKRAEAFLVQALKTAEQEVAREQKEQGVRGEATLDLEFARRALDREEAVYQRLEQRLVALRTEAAAPSRVTVVKRAAVPGQPVEAFPFKLMAPACLSCLTAPFLLAFAWEFKQQRVASCKHLAEAIALPVIGELAHLPRHKETDGDALHDQQLSVYLESVHRLTTDILMRDSAELCRVIGVVSAVSGEGKTSHSYQLAN